MPNKRILIVDDHEAILEIIKEALIYENYEVSVIKEGRLFFEIIKDFNPDLVLLDYKLADTNGADLCQELKLMQQYNHIPVIISSAYFNKGVAITPGGCNGILFKPFNLDELLALVQQHIERPAVYES